MLACMRNLTWKCQNKYELVEEYNLLKYAKNEENSQAENTFFFGKTRKLILSY